MSRAILHCQGYRGNYALDLMHVRCAPCLQLYNVCSIEQLCNLSAAGQLLSSPCISMTAAHALAEGFLCFARAKQFGMLAGMCNLAARELEPKHILEAERPHMVCHHSQFNCVIKVKTLRTEPGQPHLQILESACQVPVYILLSGSWLYNAGKKQKAIADKEKGRQKRGWLGNADKKQR